MLSSSELHVAGCCNAALATMGRRPWKLSFRATKSVSQLISTRAAFDASLTTVTRPCRMDEYDIHMYLTRYSLTRYSHVSDYMAKSVAALTGFWNRCRKNAGC